MKTIKIVVVFLFAIAVTACEDTGDSSGFSLSSSSLTFAASDDSPTPESQFVNVTVTSGEVYIKVNTESLNFGSATFELTGSNSGVVKVTMPEPGAVGIGDHVSSFEVWGCPDPFCGTSISRKQIKVTYRVDAWGKISANPLTIKGVENLSGGTASVTLDPGSSTASWTLDSIGVEYTDTTSGWLTVSPHGTSFTGPQAFTLNTAVLPGGTYPANLVFHGYHDGIPFTEIGKVIYVAGSAITLSSPLTTVNANTVVGDLAGSITVGLDPVYTGSAIAFNVLDNKPWLTVTPTSGDTSTVQALSFTIDETQLADLPNGENIATITLVPTDTTLASATTPVILNMALPTVTAVTPHLTYLDPQESLLVRGFEFNSVPGPAVTFGGVAASSVTLVSNNELMATPPFIVSSGPVHVEVGSNLLGIDRGADVYIAESIAWPEGHLTRSNGSPSRVIIDEKRRFVYVVDSTTTGYKKYGWDGSKWVEIDVGYTVSYKTYTVTDLALTPDDSALIVAISSGPLSKIAILSADGKNILGDYNLSFMNEPKCFDTLTGVAATNTNKLLMTTDTTYYNSPVVWFDLDKKTMTCTSDEPYRGGVTISTDGRRAVVMERGIFEPGFWSYSTSSDTLTKSSEIGPKYGWALSSNRHGDRVIADRLKVYDENLAPIGNLPDGYDEVVLSADGNKAYAHVAESTSVDIFDTSTLVGSTGTFAKIGTVTLTVSPGTKPRGAITGDGKTLILVGSTNLVVTALP